MTTTRTSDQAVLGLWSELNGLTRLVRARLAERLGVEVPICQATHRVLFERQEPREAVVQLMTRDLRFEEE